MQFRQRRRVIQVIRTVYDATIKRGRSELVGRLDSEDPVVDDTLRAACSPVELAEVEAFLEEHRNHRSRREGREAAQELPELMRLGEAWFRENPDGDAEQIAAEIWTAWRDLEKALLKVGVGKSKRGPQEPRPNKAADDRREV